MTTTTHPDNTVLTIGHLSQRCQNLIGANDETPPALLFKEQRRRGKLLFDVVLHKETNFGSVRIFEDKGWQVRALRPGTEQCNYLVSKIEEAIEAWAQARADIVKELHDEEEAEIQATEREFFPEVKPHSINSECVWGSCRISYRKTIISEEEVYSSYHVTDTQGEMDALTFSTTRALIDYFCEGDRNYERELRSVLSSLRAQAC